MSEKSRWPWWRSRQTRLDVGVEEGEDYHRISVGGRLTIDSSPELLARLRRVAKRAKRIEVDLRQVAFLDSSGISVLIQGLKLAQEREVAYVLLDPSPKVRAVIELSQLDQFFTIETTAEEG